MTLFRSTLIAALCLALATPAAALSCLRPDAVRLYEIARDADELFVMVRGRIDVAGPPVQPAPNTEEPVLATATVTGVALTSHAFGQDIAREITVEVECLGLWCGSTEVIEGEMFAALQVRDDALVLRIGPCGGDVVKWSRDGERRMLACHQGGACEVDEAF